MLSEVAERDFKDTDFIFTERAQEFLEERAALIKGIEESTRRELITLFQTAIDEGWPGSRVVSELRDKYEGFSTNRAKRVARTEVISSYNFGTNEAFRQSDVVERKRWLGTLDRRIRPQHLSAHGQVVPVTQPFNVGGESLRYPGDPAGSSWNTVNCRCTMLSVLKSETPPEEGVITDRDRQEYKRFTNRVAGLVGGYQPRVRDFFDAQLERLIERVESLDE